MGTLLVVAALSFLLGVATSWLVARLGAWWRELSIGP